MVHKLKEMCVYACVAYEADQMSWELLMILLEYEWGWEKQAPHV